MAKKSQTGEQGTQRPSIRIAQLNSPSFNVDPSMVANTWQEVAWLKAFRSMHPDERDVLFDLVRARAAAHEKQIKPRFELLNGGKTS